jgi:predicted Zn-dependent protease
MNFSIIPKNIQRAAIFLAALFFIPQSAKAVGETYKDIIEKSYNLVLQKDRSQAISILMAALKHESKKSQAQKELALALEQVSKAFLNDKAQQLYELALSLRTADPSMSMNKLQEALRVEPENASIEVAISRASLASGDCDGAQARMVKQKELVTFDEEMRLILAQAYVCQGKFESYLALKSGTEIKKSKLALFWQNLEIEYLFKTAGIAKAHDQAISLHKANPNFAEPLYWQWASENALKLKSEKAGQRYLALCKSMNNRTQRDFIPEANLCRRTTEVETFLKKNNNSEL